jgi:hypothetical protein
MRTTPLPQTVVVCRMENEDSASHLMSEHALHIEPYVMGRYYKVPTIEASVTYRRRVWPIIGPAHKDIEFINFDYEHYHIDARFLSEDDFKYLQAQTPKSVYAVVIHTEMTIGIKPVSPVVMRWRKCKREYPPYPYGVKWLVAMRKAYADCQLKTPVCPHRGLPLDGLKVENGVVTCPGHGLCFSVETGRLVKQPLDGVSRPVGAFSGV